MKRKNLLLLSLVFVCVLAISQIAFAQQTNGETKEAAKGWTHRLNDIAGSSFYEFGSTVSSEGVDLDWQTNLSGTSANSYQLLSGDVTGDSYLEVVFVAGDTLYIYSANGELLLAQDISVSGQNSSIVNILEDINNDGSLDIGVAYARGNSNYGEGVARIYDGEGILLKELIKDVSSDMAMYPFTVLNNDLIVAYNSGYGGGPRGFARWNLDTSEETWNYDVGPAYAAGISIADFNSDGLNELSFPNWTPHNGASGNETTDNDTYTIIINENGDSIFTQKYTYGGSNGHQRNMFVDLENDGSYKLLTLKSYNSSYTGTSRIHLSSPGDTIEYTYDGLPNAYFEFGWGDLDGDGTSEVVALNWITNVTSNLVVLDNQLNLISSMDFSTSNYAFKTITDFNGDGNNEIIIYNKDEGSIMSLDINLQTVWEYTLETKGAIKGCVVSDNNLDGKLDIVIISDNVIASITGTGSSNFGDLLATGISNSTNIREIIAGAGFVIQDTDIQNITSSNLEAKSVLALFNGGQTWDGNQLFTESQAIDVASFVENGGYLYISSRRGYENVLSQFGLTVSGNDGGSSGFDWPLIELSATQFGDHPITDGLSSIVGDVGAAFEADDNWSVIGDDTNDNNLLATRNFGTGKVVLWYGQRSFRDPGSSGNVYETDITEGDNTQYHINLFSFLSNSTPPVECNNIIITNGTYTETDDLVAAIQNEFGMNYSIADWTDIQAITNIEEWINCMELPENQTFMLTRNGEYYYNGIRQYMVHYSSDGLPYPNYLVHDQIGPLYLGSWYGLNQQILAKNAGTFLAEFSASPTQGVAPLTVQFTDLSIGTPSSWQWDFDNDGVMDSDLQNPEHIYETPGQYTVCLTVSDGTSTDEECKSDYVTVTSPYTPVECDNLILTADQYTETDDLIGMIHGEYGSDFTIADWTDLQAISDIEEWISCLGIPENQTFMLTRNGEYFYSGSRQYMVHYSSDGIPYPNYLVHDQIGPLYLGSWYGLSQQILSKNEGGFLAEFSADPTQGIAPLTVQFTDLSIGTPTSWQWDFGDGNISTEQNPEWIYDTTGQYTVCLTISDSTNTDEECKIDYITVFPPYTPVECDNLMLTADQYTETDDLIGMIQGEYGSDFTIADWIDLQAISDIEEWISCLGIPENQTFMLTRNGEYFYSGSRQYMVHYSSDGIPYPNYLVHDQIGPLYLGSWYGLNQQILAKNDKVEYFTNEFYNLDDNNVPEGWEVEVKNEPVYLSDGKLIADNSDGNGASGGLVRRGAVPEGTNNMTFEWDGNLAYTYWGMCNQLEFSFNNVEIIRVHLQTAEYNFGQENNRFKITYYNGIEGVVVYEEDIPIVLSDFHYTIEIGEDYLTFNSNIQSTGETYYSKVFTIQQLVPSYTFYGIQEVSFIAYTTTENDNWLDNISIELNDAAECDELIITNGTYTETDDLVAAIQNEFGMNYSIADWTDLQALSDIEEWIACMGIQEDQTFMLTRNGEYFYDSIRQYMVHYSTDGTPYPNYLVHDQIGPLYLDLTSGIPTSWQWDFGDGNSSTEQNPEYTYTEPGLYTVSLTVSDGTNTDTETKVDYITVEIPLFDAPYFSSINDVPNDQGRQVQAVWYKSILDETYAPDNFYTLWRQDEIFGENTIVLDNPSEILKLENTDGKYFVWNRDGEVWTYINTIPAIMQEQYAVVAPTLMDSCASGMNYSTFKVLFHNASAYYESEAAEGYSVDNLAPQVPMDFIGYAADNSIHLNWSEPVDEDFRYFAIYKTDESGLFAEEPFATTISNEITDVINPEDHNYKVSAFDFNGNESLASEVLTAQSISINNGWTGVSSYVIPSFAGIENVMDVISNELIILQNMSGMYWPGQNINTLGEWDINSGYYLKTSAEVSLPLIGHKVQDAVLELNTGWSLIPVLTDCPIEVSELFNGPEVIIVKEVAGTGVYWPQFGINTLGNLIPGKAYFVLLDEDAELEFPPCTPSNSHWRGRTGQRTGSSLCGGTPSPSGEGWGEVSQCGGTPSPLEGCAEAKPRACTSKARQGEVNKTPITHTIAIPQQVISGINDGNIITLYNQNKLCCGATLIQNQNLVLTAFGDDPTTMQMDGLSDGEAMQLRVFNPKTGEEFPLEVEFDEQMPQNGYFANHGLSALKSMQLTGLDEISKSGYNNSVYPNPSTGVFRVSISDSPPAGGLSEFDWEVSNTRGSIIAIGNNQGHNFTIDLSPQPKGIYYLRISSGGLQTVKKLVVQ